MSVATTGEPLAGKTSAMTQSYPGVVGAEWKRAARKGGPFPWDHRRLDHVSRNDLSLRERLGCFSFLSALASIWRMRSRVTENCWPTSSRVWSVFMQIGRASCRARVCQYV